MAKTTPKKKAKKATGKSATRKRPLARGADALPLVRVRMFRQGLGDCFLITFDVKGDERHMLIDCGTLGATTTGVKIDEVAKNILSTISPAGKLHVVVATHEHQDHLSGFRNKAIQSLQGKVEQVWLAWTENSKDPKAKQIAKYKNDLRMSLTALASVSPASDVAMQVTDLLGFAGDSVLGAGKFATTVDEAMEFVRTGLKAKTRYLVPGTLIEEIPGFRIYILGPPRDDKLLGNLGDHDSSELYGISSGLFGAAQFHTTKADGGGALPEKPVTDYDYSCPFDIHFNQRGDDIRHKWYPDYAADWRSINEDWTHLASELALQLDSLTNNTSLAFAIERIGDGKVLLFPADAQQGNWLSWHKVTEFSDGETGTRIDTSAADLLARTVFYKVGHHASHNATASKRGLELMEQEDELVAFIPVDRAVALKRNPKDSWQMPARPLYRRLLEKCQGRVVRSDTEWADDAANAAAKAVEREFKEMAKASEWKRWKASQMSAKHVQIDSNGLFIDYILN